MKGRAFLITIIFWTFSVLFQLARCVRCAVSWRTACEWRHLRVHWTQCTAASSRWNTHSIFSRLGWPLTNLSITWLLSAGNQLLHLNDSRWRGKTKICVWLPYGGLNYLYFQIQNVKLFGIENSAFPFRIAPLLYIMVYCVHIGTVHYSTGRKDSCPSCPSCRC